MSKTVPHFETFEEFWPYYLAEHADSTNRTLHAIGTTGALAAAAGAVLLRRPKLLAVAPLLGYGPAWVGHFIVEKNRPATFSYPAWSLRGDFRMYGMLVTGKLDAELERLGIGTDTNATRDAAE